MKNVPKLRFSGFSDEWKSKKLGALGEFFKGNGISKSELSEYGAECILYGELYTRYNEVIETIYSKTNTELGNKVLSKSNDVIIPSSGETAIDIATASCVKKDNVLLGGDLNVFRPKKVNGVFISYQLNNAKRNEIAKVAQGASVVHVYNEQLKKVIVDIPTIEEQEKIASFLTKVDRLIEKQDEKVSNLEQYKKGMMQKIFSQEIRFKKADGGEYPEWEERKIKDVADVTTGSTPSTKVSENYGEGYMWASPVDLGNSKYIDKTKTQLSKIGFENTRKLNSGSILVTCIGSTIGKIAIASTEMASNQQINAVYSISNNNEYIYYYLNYNFKNYLSYISFQAVPIINKSQFENFDIILPDIEEQDKIANFLSKIDTIVEKEKEKLEELRVWKRGLLQQMFI